MSIPALASWLALFASPVCGGQLPGTPDAGTSVLEGRLEDQVISGIGWSEPVLVLDDGTEVHLVGDFVFEGQRRLAGRRLRVTGVVTDATPAFEDEPTKRMAVSGPAARLAADPGSFEVLEPQAVARRVPAGHHIAHPPLVGPFGPTARTEVLLLVDAAGNLQVRVHTAPGAEPLTLDPPSAVYELGEVLFVDVDGDADLELVITGGLVAREEGARPRWEARIVDFDGVRLQQVPELRARVLEAGDAEGIRGAFGGVEGP